MKRVAGYVVKGKKRDEDKQRKVIEAYCLENDMVIDEWVGERGESIGEITFGSWMTGRKVDAVVIADIKYVKCNVYEFFAYKSVLKRRHSDLVAVSSDFAGYQLYVSLLNELVETISRIELENEPLRKPNDRIDKAARGTYIGGRAPMGYKAENGRLVINPEEVPVVEFILTAKKQGKTMLGTVEELNANGYRTRFGKPFVISTVQSIWKNEMFYKGYYKYSKDDDNWVKGQHEPIIKE